MLRRRRLGADGGRDRPRPEGARHARRRVRGARVRVPPGLGSHVHYDRKLDARLALALMSIQSVKGVEVGRRVRLGRALRVEGARRDRPAGGRITRAHRPGGRDRGRHEHREPIRLRAAMKPFSTCRSRSRPWTSPPARRRRDQAADRRLRGAGGRRRRRGRGGVRAGRRRAGEVRRGCAARDAAQPGALRGGAAVIVYLVGHARGRQVHRRARARRAARGAVRRSGCRDRARGGRGGRRDLRATRARRRSARSRLRRS